MKYELLFAANSHQREADFLNETVAQLEISSEFAYMNRDQLDLLEKKAESINRILLKLSKSREKSEDR